MVVQPQLDLGNWMGNLPSGLKSVPIIHLAIPGSHDSMTSSISVHSRLAPDAERFLQRLKFLGPLLRIVMSRWSRTQNLDVLGQLNCGIRYFDFRVATKKNQVYPYFVHGLYATEVEPALKTLRKFLDDRPHEVVILDFQHFYAFKQNDHDNFVRLLYGIFEDRLLPFTKPMDHVTLDYMTVRRRYQIIVIYRMDTVCYSRPNLWPGYYFPTPWPNTVSKRELVTKLDEGVADRSFKIGFVSQCVLTPSSWFVTKHMFSTLKKQCAIPLEKTMLKWLDKQKMGTGGVNIIISDFIDINESLFAAEVVKLNLKELP